MSDVAKTIEAVWKIESTRLIAAIARVTHDIGIAEELAQDALVTALEVWPEEGIPDNPGAWLMKAAKRRAIDSLRRGRMLVQKHEEIARELERQQQRLGDALEHSLDQVIDDDVLRLIFTACHPVLAVEGRIALTLRLIGGLTTAEIARAFLVPEKTLGQRISRAKKTLSEAHVPFETPSGDELRCRVESVLMVVYLIFNEGYTATSGNVFLVLLNLEVTSLHFPPSRRPIWPPPAFPRILVRTDCCPHQGIAHRSAQWIATAYRRVLGNSIASATNGLAHNLQLFQAIEELCGSV
jgi:RNA polymerase sigma-70 factor (ECF subfamily)